MAGNLFLYTQGYNTGLQGIDYKKIDIVFTSTKQDAVRLMLENGDTPTSSMGVGARGNTLIIKEQYSQNALISIMNGSNIQDFKINPDQDLYTYLCMVFDPAKPGRDACYQKAGDYIKKLGNFPPIRFVNTAKKISFNLVGKVSAACYGTIQCGGELTGFFCADKTKCRPGGTPCSDGSSCITRTICDLSLNNINCSAVTNQNTCNNDSGVRNCYIKCNTSAENFCSWSSGGGTYTCSTNGGTCAATGTCPEGLHIDASVGTCPSGQNCCIGPSTTPAPTSMTMQVVVGLDKNRNGIFDDGYYQVIEDPVDTNCGTFPNISGLTVGYSGAATGTIDYHTNCAGGAYNYPYSTKGIPATGNFTFTLNNLPSNYSLKWIEESTGKCTLSGGVVTCTGLANGQTYGLWFFIQESGVANCKNLTGPATLYVRETGTFTAT